MEYGLLGLATAALAAVIGTLAAGVAGALGIGPGDRIGVNVLGRDVEAEIASLRVIAPAGVARIAGVRWLLAPAGARSARPSTTAPWCATASSPMN